MGHIISYKLADIQATASHLLTEAVMQKIFLFYGEMGAGKTTLIKALCQELGVEGSNQQSYVFYCERICRRSKAAFTTLIFIALKTKQKRWIWVTKNIFIRAIIVLLSGPKKYPICYPTHYTEVSYCSENDGMREITLNNI
jgi:tRNA threonylcarbamoyladenosine biosynthesis protein TsaE